MKKDEEIEVINKLNKITKDVIVLQADDISTSGKVIVLQTNSTTMSGNISQLQTITGTINTNVATLQTSTTELQTITGTINTKVTQLQTITGTINTNITGLQTITGTLDTRVLDIEGRVSGNTVYLKIDKNDRVLIGNPNEPMAYTTTPLYGEVGRYDIGFYGYRGAAHNQIAAKITAYRTNENAANNATTQGMGLIFSTAPSDVGTNGSTLVDTSLERMKINQYGQFSFGDVASQLSFFDINNKLSGTAHGSIMRIGGANLVGTANIVQHIASFGASSNNVNYVALTTSMERMSIDASGWNTIALGLNYTVDNTINPNGGGLFFYNGNIGINNKQPLSRLHIEGSQISSFTGSTRGMFTLSGAYTADYFTSIDFLYQSGGLPVTRIAQKATGSGTELHFGTSNNYGTGITHTPLVLYRDRIDATGFFKVSRISQSLLASFEGANSVGSAGVNITNVDSAYSTFLGFGNTAEVGSGINNSAYIEKYPLTNGTHLGKMLIANGDGDISFLINGVLDVLKVKYSDQNIYIKNDLYINSSNYATNLGTEHNKSIFVYNNGSNKYGIKLHYDTGLAAYGTAVFAQNAGTTQFVGFYMAGVGNTEDDYRRIGHFDYYGVLNIVGQIVNSSFTRGINIGGSQIYRSNGTNPNGNLTGTAGDICINCDSNTIKKCTGGSSWS